MILKRLTKKAWWWFFFLNLGKSHRPLRLTPLPFLEHKKCYLKISHSLTIYWGVRECLTGGFLHAISHKSLFLFKPNSRLLPGTEVIVWDRLESPLVNILFTTKLLSLDPLSWGMDCLLTLWPLLIPCSLGNCCCTFDFLIFIIVERNFLYHSLYILTENSLKHLCSIRAWVPVSFFLSLSLFLSFTFLSSTPDRQVLVH